MNWTVFFVVAITFLLLSVITSIVLSKKVCMKSNRVITPFNTVFAGVFIAVFVLLLPIYFLICSGTQLQVLKAILFTFQGTLQVFTIDADSSIIIEYVGESVGKISTAYSALLSVLYVVAPIFTFGFLVSFFKNASAYIQLFLVRRRDFYVFSELNEKSLTLATDIKKITQNLLLYLPMFLKTAKKSPANCLARISA